MLGAPLHCANTLPTLPSLCNSKASKTRHKLQTNKRKTTPFPLFPPIGSGTFRFFRGSPWRWRGSSSQVSWPLRAPQALAGGKIPGLQDEERAAGIARRRRAEKSADGSHGQGGKSISGSEKLRTEPFSSCMCSRVVFSSVGLKGNLFHVLKSCLFFLLA